MIGRDLDSDGEVLINGIVYEQQINCKVKYSIDNDILWFVLKFYSISHERPITCWILHHLNVLFNSYDILKYTQPIFYTKGVYKNREKDLNAKPCTTMALCLWNQKKKKCPLLFPSWQWLKIKRILLRTFCYVFHKWISC